MQIRNALEVVGYDFTEQEKAYLEEKQPECHITFEE